MDKTHDRSIGVLDHAMARLGRRRTDRAELRLLVFVALLTALVVIPGCSALRALAGAGAGLGQDLLDGGGTGSTALDYVLEILVPILTAVGGGVVAARRQRKKRIDPAMIELRNLAELLQTLAQGDGNDEGHSNPAEPQPLPDTMQLQEQVASIASKLGQTL